MRDAVARAEQRGWWDRRVAVCGGRRRMGGWKTRQVGFFYFMAGHFFYYYYLLTDEINANTPKTPPEVKNHDIEIASSKLLPLYNNQM